MYSLYIAVGNVGKDAEMRYTPAGQAVTNFSMAVNRQWNDANGEKQKETTWLRVTTWGKQAEVCSQYVKKGMKVLVEGRLNVDPTTGGPRIWQGSDGMAHASFEVTASTVRFLSSKSEDEQHAESAVETAKGLGGVPAPVDEDDLPF